MRSGGSVMGIILVGQLDGRRKIQWGVALLLGCALGLFGAVIAVATYMALSGTFSPAAALIGFGGPFITVGSAIQSSLKLPVDQLMPLNVSAS